MSKWGQTLLQKLLSRVYIDESTGCWIFTGATNNIGYGMIRDDKKMRTTHRVSYEEHNNVKIPNLMCVCHQCDNPSCVNPSHLWLGTRKDNSQDMWKKGRANIYGRRTRKGVPQPRTICPHCNRSIPNHVYFRCHGDNCRHKP